MAPMTKGSNLPYRQLCQELGARVTMSEMARRAPAETEAPLRIRAHPPGARRNGSSACSSRATIRTRWPGRRRSSESRGADLVDVNLGCPIDYFTSKGLGAALAREPKRVRRIVEAMKQAVQRVPVTVKIRLGWNDEHRNYLDVARAAVDGGADAMFVHGRTRAARYTMSADWNAIGEVAAAVPVPVIGNGDLLFRHEIDAALAHRLHRGDVGARRVDQALAVSRGDRRRSRSVSRGTRWRSTAATSRSRRRTGARTSTASGGSGNSCCGTSGSGADTRRAAPTAAIPRCSGANRGSPRNPLEALLARSDAPAHEYLADRLLAEEPIDAGAAPGPAAAREIDDDKAEAG